MKKRKIFVKCVALGLLLAAAPGVKAQTAEPADGGIHYLLVTEKGGTETAFKLSDNPEITFAADAEGEGSVLMMNVTAGEQTLAVAVADVQEYKLVSEADIPATSIEQAVVNENGGRPDVSGGKAYFSGLKPGVQVRVYTLDGMQVRSVAADEGGNACIDLGQLKQGTVYILRTPTAGYKIMAK